MGRLSDTRDLRPTEANSKPCGCFIGFCIAETMLDALVREAVAGRNRPELEEAYRAKADKCYGGFRAN